MIPDLKKFNLIWLSKNNTNNKVNNWYKLASRSQIDSFYVVVTFLERCRAQKGTLGPSMVSILFCFVLFCFILEFVTRVYHVCEN